MTMKKLFFHLTLIAMTLTGVSAAQAQDAGATNAPAAAEEAKLADPTVEQRVADLEQYFRSGLPRLRTCPVPGTTPG
jgi:hypothetical protein